MHIEHKLKQVLRQSPDSPAQVIITCESGSKQVKKELRKIGVTIRESMSEELGILNAEMTGEHLEDIKKISGIEAIELDEEARALSFKEQPSIDPESGESESE